MINSTASSSWSTCSDASALETCSLTSDKLEPSDVSDSSENSDQTALVQAFQGFVSSRKSKAKHWRTERAEQIVHFAESAGPKAKKSPKLSFASVCSLIRKMTISKA